MSNSNTLEDFIKNYIRNVQVSSSPESYSEWLKNYGLNSKEILNESLADIRGDYEKEKSTFGANAESLSALGLTSSGYSDYLSGKAYATMQKRKEGAYGKYIENEKSNRTGFRDFVESALKERENTAKEENERFYKVMSNIVNSGIKDEEEAYRFALESGLSDEKARAVASTAAQSAYRKLTKSTLSYVLSHSFDKEQAKEYAIAVGLSESDAERIAGYAESIGQEPYLSNDFLEYLKYKENLYK